MVEYSIWCDECDDFLDASKKSAAEARRIAKRSGRLFNLGRKELCQTCHTQIVDELKNIKGRR